MNFNKELDLLDATRLFWRLVLSGNFDELDNLLAPDCRIQDQFSNTGRGLNGHDKVVTKFREVNEKINGAKIDPEMKHLQLMRNQTQVRFMIIGSYGFMKICLGFALEWQFGIVVAVVVMRNTTTDIFLNDETFKPIAVPEPTPEPTHVVTSVASEPVASEPVASEPVGPSCTSTDEPASASPSAGSQAMPVDDGKWYPGKNIKRRLSQANAANAKTAGTSSPSAAPAPFHNQTSPDGVAQSAGLVLGEDLLPPFLIPKPPKVAATVTVTVLKCTNLKSRLTRLIPRPINCYVEVNVHNCTRATPVVSKNAHPVFDTTNGNNRFIFEIPNTPVFNSRNGMIVITLRDKHALLSEDVLAVVYLPLISLKCNDSSTEDNSTHLCIPLDLFEKQKIGKRFTSGGNDDAAIARSKGRSISTDGNDKNSNTNVDVTEETPSLFLSVNKVDMQQWWLLAELKEREEEAVREKERMRDQRRAARLEREISDMRLVKNSKPKIKKRPVLIPSDLKKIHPDHLCRQDEWVDDSSVDRCQSCDIEFGVMTRKHHCRMCGQVFCNACSSFQAELLDTIEGKVVRVCRDCHQNTQSETTYHNNDHGSDSDDSREEPPKGFLKDMDRSASVKLKGHSANPNVLIGKVQVGTPASTATATATAATAAENPVTSSTTTSNPEPYIRGSYVANDFDTSSDEELSSDDCMGDEDMAEARHRVSSTDSTEEESACIIS